MLQKTVTVQLNGLAYGGKAFGRLDDGRMAFVPYGLPGETVEVHLVEEKHNYVNADIVKILEPTTGRIVAHCPHFMKCGGCHYQHLGYDHQLETKQTILREQLLRVGHIDHVVESCVSSPNEWNYRNHIQFHLACSSAENGEQNCRLGFSKIQNSSSKQRPDILPIRECHLPEDLLNQIWPSLQVDNIEGLERIALRKGADNDVMLILESNSDEIPEFWLDAPISAVHSSPNGVVVLSGDTYIIHEILGRTFRVSAEAFFQVNTSMAEKMVEHILENVALHPSITVLDIYCGVGLFSAFLAPKVAKLVGVEVSSAACEDFEVNLNEFENVELYEGRAEDILPQLDIHPNVILVDPPRSGLTRTVLHGIATMDAEWLVYISCDPATLSRDGQHLKESGFELERITPFDIFPQTYHIESISFWKRKNI